MTQNVDFTVTGHLPPSQKKKVKRMKNEKSRSRLPKTDSSIKHNFSARPSSVPVSSQWDENNPLSIQSISIPLSSRGKHSHLHPKNNQSPHQPIRYTCTRPINKRLSSSSTSSLSSSSLTDTRMDTRGHHTDRPHYSSSNSTHPPSQLPLSRTSDEQSHSRNSASLLESSNESIPEILDESVSKISSEIDSILHDINTGLIIGSPPSTERKSSGHIRSQNEDTVLQKAEDYIQSSTNPHYNMPALHDDSNHHTIEDRAAVKIQEWFREQRNIRLEKKLSEVDLSIQKRANAATIIQKWYRRKQQHKQESQLKGLLREKRNEMERNRQTAIKEPTSTVNKEQRRALKMQAARKQAIEVLQKKREEEKKEKELIIQQEMTMLEQTGVVKRSRSATKGNSKRKLNVAANFDLKKETSQPEFLSQSNLTLTPGSQSEPKLSSSEANNSATLTGGTLCDEANLSKGSPQTGDNVIHVDEFFKGGPRKTTPKRQLSPSKSHDPTNSTTVNDIFATLKELEQDPPPLPGATPTSPPGYLSKTNLDLLQRSTSHVSDQKLQSILTYLDDIQKTDPTISNGSGNIATQNTILPNEDITQQLQAASDVANDVTTTIVTQRMELENKNKTIEMLQKALKQQRELTVYHAQEMEKESQKRLDLQKQEYESTVGRHQCFIDQLIDDKKTLSDKCEVLVKEVKEMDKKHKTKTTTMENTHLAEMEKLKQTTVAAEKMRREKWRAEETQRIKEATVKSLEPEIQRIIARGKAEIQKLKAMHEAELLQADERASRRFLQQTEELRVQCAQEKEKACQHERELARQKYEQLAEQEEQSNQQLRRKLYSEIQVEKDKLAFESSNLRETISRELKELKESHQLELSKLKTEHETSTAETQRRHMNEVRDVKERLAIEKQAWEENYIRKQDAVLLTKEREMRDRLRRERDMEIETVIQRLEVETATAREECERASESRVKRIREKYETELKEVEKSERQTLEKYNTMKGQLTEYEGDIIRLRSQLRMRDEEVERVNEIATRLTKERDRVADVVRQEFVDRLIALEEENRHLKLEINELKSRHSLELSRKEREKERELEEVHQRVKEALTKKEDNYRGLRSQHEAALKRADHLEMLLEQQRKQLLKR